MTLSDNAFGCRSLHDLRDVLRHRSRGEHSSAAAITSGPFCFDYVEPSMKWTVYQVDGALVQVGFSGLDQYDAAKDRQDIDARAQYWVAERFVRSAD